MNRCVIQLGHHPLHITRHMHSGEFRKRKTYEFLSRTGMLEAQYRKRERLLFADKVKGVHLAEEWMNGTVSSGVQKHRDSFAQRNQLK